MTELDKYAIITEEICQQIEPGKKMLQKLFYLMERKGVKLNLNYSIHFFGPYSAKLDMALHTLENYDAVEIDTSKMTHIIKIGSSPIKGILDSQEQEKISWVLEQFINKTALELEALTTLDYAATEILKGSTDDAQIIEQVHKIKGTKFTIPYLREELNVLKVSGYLS